MFSNKGTFIELLLLSLTKILFIEFELLFEICQLGFILIILLLKNTQLVIKSQ